MGRAGFTSVGREGEGEGHLTELRGVFPEGMGAGEGERGGRRRGHFKERGISLLSCLLSNISCTPKNGGGWGKQHHPQGMGEKADKKGKQHHTKEGQDSSAQEGERLTHVVVTSLLLFWVVLARLVPLGRASWSAPSFRWCCHPLPLIPPLPLQKCRPPPEGREGTPPPRGRRGKTATTHAGERATTQSREEEVSPPPQDPNNIGRRPSPEREREGEQRSQNLELPSSMF